MAASHTLESQEGARDVGLDRRLNLLVKNAKLGLANQAPLHQQTTMDAYPNPSSVLRNKTSLHSAWD